jgi:hypothetical protein
MRGKTGLTFILLLLMTCTPSTFRQWLFIIEGLPSVVLGVALALFLPETPVASKWLTEEQKELFTQDVSS